MYELIGSNKTRTMRVLWMLEELGVDFTYKGDFPHSDLVSSLNPSGKVPILKVDDAVITDSTAIMTYLADKHGAFTHPAGTLDRARQDRLTYQILDELDAVLWTMSRHSFILPEDKRVPEIKPSLRWEFDRNVARIADCLQRPFLMGEKMTIPDFILTHCLNWAFAAKVPVEDEKLNTYGKMMRARKAYRRAAAR